MAQELIDKIRAAAQARGIDPELALSIARAESSFDPQAKARTSSASGLFQVTKDTWKEFGGKPGRQLDPDENIRVGLDIIAKNTSTLKSALGREPRPAEVYAAHYFGPSGAKSFLSADPETPIASILGERAVKANPNLKGKTAGQVLAQLEGKVGSALAPAVSRETPPASTRTPAEEIVEPALRSGMTAQAPASDKLAALGPGYQAALALSFLSDEDEKEGRDPDTGPSMAEEWLKQTASRPAALAMGDISVKSPFEAQPVMMNEGGDVSTAAKMLKEVVPMDLRMLGSTLMGSREPITESNFNPQELAAMQQAVDRAVARTGRAQKGSVQYQDYPRGEEIGPGFQPVGQTLGRFTYEKMPDGTTVVRDRYDFYNEGRKENVEAYEKMGRGQRAATVAARMLKNLVTGDLRGVPNELADAYIGREGRDVTIKLPPVKRAGGGDAEPTPEELAAASRPATVNPMIRRQGEAARRLAAMRDVNTLPDPRTYAAVTGFLGAAPDEMGFSALHPDIEGIKKAGEAGFYAGTATQVAPIGAAIRGLTSKGTTTAAKMLEGVKNLPVGASVKPVEPFFQHIPSAEAPFVGRLDEFVAGMQAPVQKEQFLGMLKGKFRDYDIARAQAVLDDLPAKAKISPSDLLNRLKSQYDPSTFRTTIVPPGSSTDFFRSVDNPYSGSTGNGPSLGVIHLSQAADPASAQARQVADSARRALSQLDSRFYQREWSPQIADDLMNAADSGALQLSETTANNMRSLATQYRQLAAQENALEKARSDMLYPALSTEYKTNLKAYQEEELLRQPGITSTESWRRAEARVVQEAIERGNRVLQAEGLPPVSMPDFSTTSSPGMWAIDATPQAKAATQEINGLFDIARAPLITERNSLIAPANNLISDLRKEIGHLIPYKGQHTTLKNPDDTIAFSRFSEHTADIPGIGKADGIYVNELQSDRLDDLRKLGPRGGSPKKDTAEIDELMGQHDELQKAMYTSQAAGNDDLAKQYDAQSRGIRKRISTLSNRKVSGEYSLPESFAGMESSPQVTQQLMIKNAITGAMQMGKQFVAFPGAESAQAQLYEKLPFNLKQVVKDLGPGFELRDVTLVDPDGKQLMHRAVVWGPEAAARLQKKGVPFKAGGLVERTTADTRKYL